MKTFAAAGLGLLVLGIVLLGCSDQSENIPTNYTTLEQLMSQGWNQYNAGDYSDARQTFGEATELNALYLPSYDGLGWCAVRLTDFADAAVQFSFITTLAEPGVDDTLLADAYAGLALAATLERSVMELPGTTEPEVLQALALESINYALEVFVLLQENYAPTEHDTSFGSDDLHLLNAENYFYLQDFAHCESELNQVDATGFVNQTLQLMGTPVADETISLVMTVASEDTSWFLTPANPGIHHITQIDPTVNYQIIYSENQIQVLPTTGIDLQTGMSFTVSYLYIEEFAAYLYELIEFIESLINP